MKSETLTSLGIETRTPDQLHDEALAALGNLRTTCLQFSRQLSSVESLEEALAWFKSVERARRLIP